MVQIAFFLQYGTQLRRTRGNLIPQLEGLAIAAMRDAGGEIAGGGGNLRASFDEGAPGFWLDMLFLIERLSEIVGDVAGDLCGHSVILARELPEGTDRLCRLMSGAVGGGGVFLDGTAAGALRPYVTVEDHGKWGGTAFFKMGEEKVFVSTARGGFALSEKNIRLFEPGRRPAVLVAGNFFEGRRDSLYAHVARFADPEAQTGAEGGRLPPLFLRFGSGGLNAVADAWPAWAGEDALDGADRERLVGMRDFLFRQRLRRDASPFAAGIAREFIESLLTLHAARAAREGVRPAVVIENVDAAEPDAADIVVAALVTRKDFVVAGTCAPGSELAGNPAGWKRIFATRFARDGGAPAGIPDTELPPDLWEIGYLCLLIGGIWPPDATLRMLGEMGKSPGATSRAVSMLHALRIIDTPLDPRSWQESFRERAETALGGRAEGLRTLVRGRLLEWVARRKISPCANLLRILAELGAPDGMDEAIILKSIHGELACNDGATLARFVDSGECEAAIGAERAPAVAYAVRGLLALHFGGEREVTDALSDAPPECSAFPLLKAQMFLNQSLYHLGWHDGESAKRTTNAATLLCQGYGNSWLSRCHRLFALASLSVRRVGETNEYLGFALENAAKSGEPHEIGLASFYTASVQLLHGNLSKSQFLVRRALRHFLEAGSPEWADRSRFLDGRILFETGAYREAADVFAGIRGRPHGGGFREKASLLEAWGSRCEIYDAASLGLPPPPRQGTRPGDAEIFDAEAMFLAGDFEGAVALADRVAGSGGGAELFYGTEQPDWRSGFAQCELLYFPWHYLRDRMLGTFRALAQSRLSPQDGNMALGSMREILHGGRFTEIDPSDAFFHYALYMIQRQTDAGAIDLRTAVSMAYKKMQVRSERIDDPGMRRRFISRPYWNKTLEATAKELRIV